MLCKRDRINKSLTGDITFIVRTKGKSNSELIEIRDSIIEFQDIAPVLMMPDLELIRLGTETIVIHDSELIENMAGIKDLFVTNLEINRGRSIVTIHVESEFNANDLKHKLIEVLKQLEPISIIDPIPGIKVLGCGL